MKINKKFLICGAIIFSFCLFQILNIMDVPSASASSLWDAQQGTDQIAAKFGQDSKNPSDIRAVTVNIIKIFLTFLGLIFLVMIIFAGFKWMTAAGNEERVKDAKSQITAATIGMIIVLSAFLITNFIVSRFDQSLSDSIWPR
jgi:amino acid transporter